MALSNEYERKIQCFLDNFQKRMYKPYGTFGYSGFITKERLTLEEAYAHSKEEFTEGTEWGTRFQYAWFFTEITIPKSLDGNRVVITAKPGECVVFVNGEVYGALDREHTHIIITQNAKAGDVYKIAIEAYAGHSGCDVLQIPNNMVLLPEENISEFPEDKMQKTINNGSFGILYEEIFKLWIELDMLYDLRNCLEDNSLRKNKIDKGLMEICNSIDIEADFDKFLKDVKVGREILKPLLECKNGSTTPVVYAVGNSHIDLEWKWTVNETRRKAARTLGNQLKLMEEYDDYVYLHSQPWSLEIVKEEYPELYKKVKKAVADGKICVEGGMWVEADTNIPSGESLIRQFVFGKRFIKEEFGHDSEILWLPDVFGITGSLPQIMKGCGVKYLMNAKLPWLYNGGDAIPCSTFQWQGIDGTEILSHITSGYAADTTPTWVIDRWNMNHEKTDVPVALLPFGYGDGGGGATKAHLERLEKASDLEGMPKVKKASANEFYKYLEDECDVTRRYVGELYYAAHQGTYTSQAMNKKLNRRAEFALRDAEMWSTLLGDGEGARLELFPLWKKVLFNQFHDVIPGSGIKEVHERANKSYAEVIENAEKICDKALCGIVKEKEDTITIFNSLSWERMALITLPDGYNIIIDAENNYLSTQLIDGKTVALVKAPACGFITYKLQKGEVKEADINTGLVLENAYIKAEFNHKGELISLFNKEKNMEYLTGPSNIFRMYQDMPTFSDAWDIDNFYENVEVTLDDEVEVIPECKGKVMSSLLIKRKINNSRLTQRVVLREDSKQLDFETEIDYNERHKLLKVDFNTNIHTEEIISETQFGYIKRPNHKSRPYDADRFEVWQHKWSALAESKRGMAILNDSKYGISADKGRMSLTLLKSAAAPDLYADKGVHNFTYSVMPIGESLTDSDVVRAAYELNAPVIAKIGDAGLASLLETSEKNIIINTVKSAEDESGDIIVRLYECMNSCTPCGIEFGFDVKKAYICDMLENKLDKIEVSDNKLSLDVKAFEVVTIRIEI